MQTIKTYTKKGRPFILRLPGAWHDSLAPLLDKNHSHGYLQRGTASAEFNGLPAFRRWSRCPS
jgi:hypothetical protein